MSNSKQWCTSLSVVGGGEGGPCPQHSGATSARQIGGEGIPPQTPQRMPGPSTGCHHRSAEMLRVGRTHRRQDSGQLTRQHRLSHPRWAEEEDVVITTPASGSLSHPELAVMSPPQDDGVVISHPDTADATMPLDNLQAWSSAQDNSSSSALASCRSAVSKPSVNQA